MTAMSSIDARDPRAEQDQKRWDELKTDRSEHEQMWEAIARLFRPQRGGFGLSDPAGRRHEKPLSSAPIHAQNNFSAGLYGTLSNPANDWGGLETNDPSDQMNHENKLWLDDTSNRILASFQPSVSTFYTSVQQVYGDVAAFGNAAQYDEVIASERRILDITVSLSEIVYDIDGFGRVCDVVRKFMLTPQQAIDMFQGEATLPAKLHEMAEKQDRTRFAFYHRVGKNSMYSKGKLGPSGKAWFSRYSCEIDCTLIRVAGYDEMPFYAPRWDVDTGHTYGTGPAFNALASARIHNRMTDATVRAAQRAADPTILAPDKGDWPLNGLIQPGKVVYGAINPMNGQTMLRPLDVTGAFNLTLQERQNVMEEIRDAFHYSLMSLSGRTGMTATEVMAITEERQRLWAPHQGRLQEEYLAPKFARRFTLLWKAGQLRPPPSGLAGKELRVTYRSAAAAAQRSVEGNAALRILQDIAPLAQMSPEAAQRLADRLDPDGTLEVLMEARGAPTRMIRSRDDADARGKARAEAQQQMQQMEAMKQGAGMVKDLAGAEAAMAGGGA